MIPSWLRTLVIAVVLAAAFGFTYWKYRQMDSRYEQLQKSHQAVEELRKEIKVLENKLEKATEKANALQNDPLESEANARKIGKFVRPDETVFHIPDMPRQSPAPAAASQTPSMPPK